MIESGDSDGLEPSGLGGKNRPGRGFIQGRMIHVRRFGDRRYLQVHSELF